MPGIFRLRVTVRGAVQGVGFRPFIYRLATELGLRGWVNNSAQGVFIEVEGPRATIEGFLLRLDAEKPPRSFIQSLESSWLDPKGFENFAIRESDVGGAKTALVLPDIATCPDCCREILDPADRRYFYPFTNCTNCGPRFSIIEALPYDRANTSMKKFTMCPQCQAEYENPGDRRFHAQPNACPVCGPRLELWGHAGTPLASRESGPVSRANLANWRALSGAAAAFREGKIVAVKGLGGFHLMVAASDEDAVRRLRKLKHREEKPFALMFPSLVSARSVCEISPLEERLLLSPEAPITLLRTRPRALGAGAPVLAKSIAPHNPYLGVLLPYTPLHHLLLSMLGSPVVATSGNFSDEPICIDEHEALSRLGQIADLFLVHNRPIVRHVDDSVARVMAGREMILRRARGFAPLPVAVPAQGTATQETVLAVGAHLKNTVALAVGPQVFISQHIGDLETDAAYQAFRGVITDFEKLYEASPAVVAADLHPDYLSTGFANELAAKAPKASGASAPAVGPLRQIAVQHHLAHILSCMAENELEPPVLGVSWDGTGLGPDGTVWGGEFLLVEPSAWKRVGHLRRFRLPGGDRAVREPRRAALGLLYELFGDQAFGRDDLLPIRSFSSAELDSLRTMLARGLHAPWTSSAGRLFDAVSSLLGLRQQVRFEGQGAIELEFAAHGFETRESYPFEIIAAESATAAAQLDWAPAIRAICTDLEHGVSSGEISSRFHNALAEAIAAFARISGQKRVVLSGGCWQNRLLTERTVERLQRDGFQPYWHQRVPPNDGGIALGQVAAARRPLSEL
jgi:hydrogenase maturation protein HypF